MTPEEFRAKRDAWQAPFRAKFDDYCKRAQAIFPAFRKPTLQFLGRGQRSGFADYNTNTVRLNPTFCHSHERDMLNNTLPHEIAHILAHQRYGHNIAAHGGEWYAMFGALTWRTPTRCHAYGDVNVARERIAAQLTGDRK